MSWGSSIIGLFRGLEQMEKSSDKTSHMLKENHCNENCRNICYLTDLHLPPQLALALQSCCMEGESKPNFKSLKGLRRMGRDLLLQTGRHDTRMLNGNRDVLMVQTKELCSLMCQETRCYG